MNNNFQLTSKILEKSQSKIWSEAVKEWKQIEVYEVEVPESCLCGHYPITEICVIQNQITKDTEFVGNCCVKKFLGLRPDMTIKFIKRIKKDITSSVNIHVLNFALERKYISKADYNFYSDTWRKSVLTGKQEKWRIDINKRMLSNISLDKKYPSKLDNTNIL